MAEKLVNSRRESKGSESMPSIGEQHPAAASNSVDDETVNNAAMQTLHPRYVYLPPPSGKRQTLRGTNPGKRESQPGLFSVPPWV